MNIFVLDKNPKIAATYHCDKHVVKMIVEYGQILCTSLRLLIKDRLSNIEQHYKHLEECVGCKNLYRKDFNVTTLQEFTDFHLDKLNEVPYKETHKSHPCVLWARKDYINFFWLLALEYSLIEEYKYRYSKKEHKTEKVLDFIKHNLNFIERLLDINNKSIDFVMVMPDEYKDEDVVRAYRQYYIHEKCDFAKWANKREQPYWWMSNNEKLHTGNNTIIKFVFDNGI